MCKDGCGACCGVVPFERRTFARLKSKAKRSFTEFVFEGGLVYPVSPDGTCVFLDESKRCAVYQDRPDVCRQYGEIEELPCPYFKPDGTPRSAQEAREMTEKIERNVDAEIEKLKKRR